MGEGERSEGEVRRKKIRDKGSGEGRGGGIVGGSGEEAVRTGKGREEERREVREGMEREEGEKEEKRKYLIDLSLRVLQGSLQCVSPGLNVSNSHVQLRVSGVLRPTCLVLCVCVCVKEQGVFEFAASKTDTMGYAALCNLPPLPCTHNHTPYQYHS